MQGKLISILNMQNNSVVNDFIGICEYEKQNGWSRGNTCQWKRPEPGAHREYSSFS